jgi:dTDP-4-dehydrorhamnose 3,5-epimerase-like enzyme
MAKIKDIEKKCDNRGWLAEIFKTETTGIPGFGLVFVTTANPGFVKGNHFHNAKREWMCVIQGRGELTLEDIQTGRRETIGINGDSLRVLEIEPGVAHAFKNVGDELLVVLEYVNKAFDPQNPDTYPHVVIA